MKQHFVVMSVELNSMVNCLSRILSYNRCRYLASKYRGWWLDRADGVEKGVISSQIQASVAHSGEILDLTCYTTRPRS